jgi:hypothetical protein
MRVRAVAAFSVALTLTVCVALGYGAQDEAHPSAFFPATSYEFSSVLEGNTVMHEFVIQNKGNAPLKVERVKTG